MPKRIIFLILSFVFTNSLFAFESTGRLLFEQKWGSAESEISISENFWDATVDHFFVRNNEVFIADNKKEKVLYFLRGKYEKSFEYPSSNNNIYGLIAIGDYLYVFFDNYIAVSISIKNGKIAFSRSFSYPNTRSNTYVYAYNNLIVISKRITDSGNTEIETCLDNTLSDISCPNEIKPIEEENIKSKPFQYLSALSLVFPDTQIVDSNIHFTIKYLNLKTKHVEKIAYYKDSLEYDMSGQCMYDENGIYYVTHTQKSMQIWFAPWHNIIVSKEKNEI